MNLEFFHTPGHGYLKVSKKNIAEQLPEIIEKISKCSGQDLEYLYLEEDIDFAVFLRATEAKEIDVNIINSHIEEFDIVHNYSPESFNFKFNVGDRFLYGEDEYTVVNNKPHTILASMGGKIYNIPKSNPFQYVDAIVSNKDGQTLLNF